jgi:hypothetical protein
MRAPIRQLVKNHRRTMTPAQRRASYRKKWKGRYPVRYENQLYSRLRDAFGVYSERLLSFVKAKYPRKAVTVVYPTSGVNLDDFASEWENYLSSIEKEFTQEVVKGGLSMNLAPFMERIAAFVLAFDEKEVADYFNSITGKPFYGTTEWWDEMESNWMNIALDRASGSVNTFYVDIRKTVLDATRNNMSYEDLMEILLKKGEGLDRKKADFLARDLTGKLNGAIERKLQQSLGIDTYFWQTAADERVRGRPGGRYPDALPSHWSMDSLVCSWSDPSIVSFDYGRHWVPRLANMPIYHPGMDWRCRCLGTPFSLDVLLAIDKELSAERD